MRPEEAYMDDTAFIIDAHVHTYPNVTVGRQALGPLGYGYAGTMEDLKEVMKQANLSYAVTANMTPTQEMIKANLATLDSRLTPDQEKEAIQGIHRKVIERMQRRNQWTCQSASESPQLVPLISFDVIQSPEEMVEELTTKATQMGAKGVKLQRLWPLYAKAQELKLPILFHSGASELPNYESKYGRPSEFIKVAEGFPRLTIVLAHLGKGYFEEAIELAQRTANIFFDTSGCFLGFGPPTPEIINKVGSVIKKIGITRVMFGSDWPWFDPAKDIAIIKNMEFTSRERSMILGENAKRIYNL